MSDPTPSRPAGSESGPVPALRPDGSPADGSHRTRLVEAIEHGTVIDHIPSEVTLRVAQLVAKANDQVFIGVNLRSGHVTKKGVVKIAGRELDGPTLSRLALIAPEATINIIRDYRVVSKMGVPLPPEFAGIARCPNPNCVTNHERWPTRFEVIAANPLSVRCQYCERFFRAAELVLTGPGSASN